MKFFIIGDLKQTIPRGINGILCKKYGKGLIQAGSDVYFFSYRDTMKLFMFKKKEKTDELMLELTKHYIPDVIIVSLYKKFDTVSLEKLKENNPCAIFVFIYGDPWLSERRMVKMMPYFDWFIATGGGELLKSHKKAGASKCAFLPNPCDPDLEKNYSPESRFKNDILFTGVSAHKDLPEQDPERMEIYRGLSKMKNASIYSGEKNNRLEGIDYFKAMCSTKIFLSINTYNHLKYYHSDRLINGIGCGAFTLAKYVPDSEKLFEDKKHLRYFHTVSECFDLMDYYLKNSEERIEIAKAGQLYAHTEMNCKRIAGHLINIIQTGSYNAKYKEVLI